MDTNTSNFIEFVKSECAKHGVKFKPYKRKYIKLTDSIKCGGYFSDGADDSIKVPTLAFAQGSPDYLELLVHEYCHMTQWLDKIPLWDESEDSMNKIDQWLSGKRVHNIQKHLASSRDLELDNEIRSVKMIKKWKLPIDIATYTKKANAYVIFYNYMKYSRKWSSPGNSPYKNQIIIGAMSKKFDMEYETISPELVQLYRSQNI